MLLKNNIKQALQNQFSGVSQSLFLFQSFLLFNGNLYFLVHTVLCITVNVAFAFLDSFNLTILIYCCNLLVGRDVTYISGMFQVVFACGCNGSIYFFGFTFLYGYCFFVDCDGADCCILTTGCGYMDICRFCNLAIFILCNDKVFICCVFAKLFLCPGFIISGNLF